jgi:hypothetical protein
MPDRLEAPNRPQPSQMIVYWTATQRRYAERNESRTAFRRKGGLCAAKSLAGRNARH